MGVRQDVSLTNQRGRFVGTQVSRQKMLDVYVRDLAGTLKETERSARVIRRAIALVPPQPRTQQKSQRLARLDSATSRLVAEAKRLLRNASDCQTSLRKLQRELTRLRRE